MITSPRNGRERPNLGVPIFGAALFLAGSVLAVVFHVGAVIISLYGLLIMFAIPLTRLVQQRSDTFAIWLGVLSLAALVILGVALYLILT
jgi:hypothetical protein